MRGASVILGTLITLTIVAASQAAMVADLRAAAGRAAERDYAAHQAVDPVWYGGQLPPVVVEVAPGKAPAATAHMVPRHRAVAKPPRGVSARIS
jgi:hypothetical protein